MNVPKRREVSVALYLTKCQEAILGTLTSILVPKSIMHGVVPQLVTRFLGMVYNRQEEQLTSYVTGNLYTVWCPLRFQPPCVCHRILFVDNIEYFGFFLYPEDGGNKRLRSIGICPYNYTAPLP